MNPTGPSQEEVLSWWGEVGAQVSFDPAGVLTGLRVGEEERLVASLGLERVGEEPYRPDVVRIDADEVETSGVCGGVEVRLRQSFDHTWQFRLGLINRSDRLVRVGRVILHASAGPDSLLHVHAAGAVGVLTFHRMTGPGCLGLCVTRGDLVVDDGELGTPELTLAPRGRYQLVLAGEWYAEPAGLRQRYPTWFPESVDLAVGDEDLPLGHADAAAVHHHPDPPTASAVVRIEVCDAAGVTRLEVAYASEVATYAEIAETVLACGRVGAAAEGLCLHRALADRTVAHDEARALIEDYLENPSDPVGPLRAVLRARTQDWADDPGPVQRAIAELAELAPGPGVPLAWLLVWSAAGLLGMEPQIEAIAARLSPLVTGAETDAVTRAEMALMVRGGRAIDRARMARAIREVGVLCAPGPGAVWPPRPDAERARAIVVRSLLRPDDGEEQPDLHEPVRRIIARAGTAIDGVDALAWLSLRAPVE